MAAAPSPSVLLLPCYRRPGAAPLAWCSVLADPMLLLLLVRRRLVVLLLVALPESAYCPSLACSCGCCSHATSRAQGEPRPGKEVTNDRDMHGSWE
ncbi:hypothetical protein U9M48_002413 [Paspalum notatum var. saurae]|uniref:Uncharacterized protein n=1 Tax=Paspalum notatum var. saurae TaxID=547442 RepID=A0AAQ3PNZ2_PASNO